MLISVIITVYNKERYVDRCIKSVINQTYKDLEIIIINDGSNDESESHIKRYLYDKRIIYISQKNNGVAFARNKGIKVAKSKYIFFLDGDDELEKNAISELSKKTIDCPDIVIGNFIFKKDKYCIRNKPLKVGKYYSKVQLNNTQFKFDMFTSNGRPLASVCNKLYRKEFLEANKLFFESYIVSEDRLFNLYAFCYEPKIVVTNNYTYIVNLSENSRSRSFNDEFYGVSIALFEKLKCFLIEKSLYDKNLDLLFFTLLNDVEKIHSYIFNYSKKRYSDMLYYSKLIINDQDKLLLIKNGLKQKFLVYINNNGKKFFLLLYAHILAYTPQLLFGFFTIYRGAVKLKEIVKRKGNK